MLKERHFFALHHLAKHLGDRFSRSGTSLCWALGRFVGTSTIGSFSVLLLLVALGYDMPYSFAPITPGNAVVRVRVMEVMKELVNVEAQLNLCKKRLEISNHMRN